jgi:hypothetical protein
MWDENKRRPAASQRVNRGRPHYRFQKPGGAYEGPLAVEARLKDGRVETWSVPDPSQRTA